MLVGADYYPEHWPHERWVEDARLMAEAGLGVVRMAEFAWCRMETEPGRFDFAWLDEAIDLLGNHGIKTVLGTPTAVPPAWLIKAHPEMLPIDASGCPASFGVRHHRCVNSPALIEATRRLVGEMARHYGKNKNVLGYQIDNEFGCHHDAECCCDACLAAWRQWLKARYGSVEELNRRWGLIFWSQEVRDWNEVWLPKKPMGGEVGFHSPSLLLDYVRFMADSFTRYAAMQAELLRAQSAGKFITHNFMGMGQPIDPWKLKEPFDLISMDRYPSQVSITEPSFVWPAMGLDVTRGLARGPFWVMEEEAGSTGWSTMSPTPRPGQIALWSWQAVARGAEAVVFFRWRTCRFGTEQYWHGLLGHDGVPRRRYSEAARFASQFHALEKQIEGTANRCAIAILDDYASNRAIQFQPGAPGLSRWDLLGRIYGALVKKGLTVDFVSADGAWEGYRVLVVPALFVAADKVCARLVEFVRKGGKVALTFRSGVKDEYNVVRDSPLPGPFAEMAGILVEEYDPLGAVKIKVKSQDGRDYEASIWADFIALKGARTLATYSSEFYAGTPAVTVNDFGKGRCYYVGAWMENPFWDDFAGVIASEAGEKTSSLPDGLEMVRRRSADRSLVFLLNHTSRELKADVSLKGKSLLSGAQWNGGGAIAPFGVEIIEEKLK